MKSTQILVLFTFASLSVAATDTGGCVQDHEAKEISQRWLNIFASGGSGGLAQAVTENITIYDEGANNGSTAAYLDGASQLGSSLNASSYGGGGVSNVAYDVLFTFNTCDQIALRWQQNVLTADGIGFGSTVTAGKAISFKGTDLLTIDLSSKKVMNVTTSADLLNYYRALGYPLGVENTTLQQQPKTNLAPSTASSFCVPYGMALLVLAILRLPY